MPFGAIPSPFLDPLASLLKVLGAAGGGGRCGAGRAGDAGGPEAGNAGGVLHGDGFHLVREEVPALPPLHRGTGAQLI